MNATASPLRAPMHTVLTLTLTGASVVLISESIRLIYSPDLKNLQARAAAVITGFTPVPAIPEPMEQMQYAVLTPIGILLMALFAATLWPPLSQLGCRSTWITELPAWVIGGGFLVLLCAICVRENFRYLSHSMFVEWPILHFVFVVPLTLLAYHFKPLQRLRWLHEFVKWTLMLLLGCAAIVDSLRTGNALPSGAGHFNSVMYPLAMVSNGVPIGRHVFSHYGFYPTYVAPLVNALGGQIWSVCLVFGALVAVVCWASIECASTVLKNPILRICVAVSLPYVGYFVYFPHDDPYFQYWPIRTLFPALVLLALAKAAQSRGDASKRLGVASFLAATALFWNTDSGIACVASVVAYAVIRNLAIGAAGGSGWYLDAIRLGRDILALLGGALAAVIAFMVLYRLQVHVWPDYPYALGSTMKVAELGYTFMPFENGVGFWLVYVVIAGACCLYAFRLLLSHRAGLASFHVAVGAMLLTLFVYHVGRSHWSTLLGPMWLVPLALGLILERLDETMRGARAWAFGRVLQWLILAHLASGPAAIAMNLGQYWDFSKEKLTKAWHDRGVVSNPEKTATFIRKYSDGQSKIMLFAYNQEGVLYLLSRRVPALEISSSTDLIFREEHARILSFLSHKPDVPIFVNASGPTSYSAEIDRLLATQYQVAVAGPDINLLERKHNAE